MPLIIDSHGNFWTLVTPITPQPWRSAPPGSAALAGGEGRGPSRKPAGWAWDDPRLGWSGSPTIPPSPYLTGWA
jgi:hypothetical protein